MPLRSVDRQVVTASTLLVPHATLLVREHRSLVVVPPQTMAMVESIWPSEQLATALTNPVDDENLDPADPQVGAGPCHVYPFDMCCC